MKDTHQAVIFDLGQVICPFDLMVPCRTLSDMNGMAPQEIKETIFFGQAERDFETGKIDGEEFTRRCLEILKVPLTPKEFRRIWTEMFLVDEQTLKLIKELKPYSQLLLLSNTCPWHIEYVEKKYQLRKHFDNWLLSFQVGAMKPDEKIYRAALDIVDYPDHMVFIDDLQVNIDVARKLGIPSIRFTSADQVRTELLKRDFLRTA